MGYIDDTLDDRIYEDYLENNNKSIMKKTNEELQKITTEVGVSKEDAKTIIEAISTLSERVDGWAKLAEVSIESEEDEQGMALSKENRLAIKRDRLEIEKFTDAQRKAIQEKKAPLDAQDKAWLKIKQHFEKMAKELESKLEEQEKYAENLAKERAIKKVAERKELLSLVCEDPDIYPLDNMSDAAFLHTYKGLKALKEQEEAEAKKAEEIRLEQEKIEKEAEEKRKNLLKERSDKLLPYEGHGPSVPISDIADLEDEYFEQLLQKKKESKEAWEVEQENKEKERQAQARATAEANEKARKLQEELAEKNKKEAEEKAEKEKADAAAKAEAEKLAKAPDKEKLLLFVESFKSTPQTLSSEEANKVYQDILTKFYGFTSWAKKEIEKL